MFATFRVVTGHKDSVTFASFSHDAQYVATGDMSGLIKVWKVSASAEEVSTSGQEVSSSGQEVWSFEIADLEVRAC